VYKVGQRTISVQGWTAYYKYTRLDSVLIVYKVGQRTI